MLLTFGAAVNNTPPETRSFRPEVSGRASLSGFWLRLSPALLVPAGGNARLAGPSKQTLEVNAPTTASDQPALPPLREGTRPSSQGGQRPVRETLRAPRLGSVPPTREASRHRRGASPRPSSGVPVGNDCAERFMWPSASPQPTPGTSGLSSKQSLTRLATLRLRRPPRAVSAPPSRTRPATSNSTSAPTGRVHHPCRAFGARPIPRQNGTLAKPSSADRQYSKLS